MRRGDNSAVLPSSKFIEKVQLLLCCTLREPPFKPGQSRLGQQLVHQSTRHVKTVLLISTFFILLGKTFVTCEERDREALTPPFSVQVSSSGFSPRIAIGLVSFAQGSPQTHGREYTDSYVTAMHNLTFHPFVLFITKIFICVTV